MLAFTFCPFFWFYRLKRQSKMGERLDNDNIELNETGERQIEPYDINREEKNFIFLNAFVRSITITLIFLATLVIIFTCSDVSCQRSKFFSSSFLILFTFSQFFSLFVILAYIFEIMILF